jgi:transitional endoplasmic reticulum ATPase
MAGNSKASDEEKVNNKLLLDLLSTRNRWDDAIEEIIMIISSKEYEPQVFFQKGLHKLIRNRPIGNVATESKPPAGNEPAPGDKTEKTPVADETTQPDTPNIRFSDLAGFTEIKNRLKEEIQAYMSDEYRLDFSGRTHHILLYGPPGIGKTALIRGLAGECGCKLYEFSATKVKEKYSNSRYRSSNEIDELDKCFKAACSNQPSIVFIDDLEELYESRYSTTDRTFNELLCAKIRSLTLERVFVIGASTNPWKAYPKLKGRGMLSRIVYMGPPKHEDTVNILKILIEKYRFPDSLNAETLADLLRGYTPADMMEIFEDVALQKVRDHQRTNETTAINQENFARQLINRRPQVFEWYEKAKYDKDAVDESYLYQEMLNDPYFVDARFLEDDKLSFDNVGGLENIKKLLTRDVLVPLQHPEEAKEAGKTYGGGILLYGPPGCGKTFIARTLGRASHLPYFEARISDFRQLYHGSSIQSTKGIFLRAKSSAPSILFIDEIDGLGGKRKSTGMQWEREYMNQFLQEISDLKDTGVVLIAATNAPWDIDPAIRRSGRFNKLVYISSPDNADRAEIFKIYLQQIRLGEGIDYNRLSSLTAGWSSSDIEAICQDVSDKLLDMRLGGATDAKADLAVLETAIKGRKSSLTSWFMQALKELEKSGEDAIFAEIKRDIEENARGAQPNDEVQSLYR